MSAPERIDVGDILKASEGMLQKQLYVIFTEPAAGLGPILENIEEHLKFQVDLEQRGVMFAAGPLWTDDEKSWTGSGMVVVRAGSRDEAVAIAESDPMHQCGARTFTVRPWLINEGSVTVKISYSGQRCEVL